MLVELRLFSIPSPPNDALQSSVCSAIQLMSSPCGLLSDPPSKASGLFQTEASLLWSKSSMFLSLTYSLTGANLALDAVDTKSIQKLNQLAYKFAKLFSFVGEKSLFCTWLCIFSDYLSARGQSVRMAPVIDWIKNINLSVSAMNNKINKSRITSSNMIVLKRAKRTSFLKLNFFPQNLTWQGLLRRANGNLICFSGECSTKYLLGHWIFPTSAIIVSSKAWVWRP